MYEQICYESPFLKEVVVRILDKRYKLETVIKWVAEVDPRAPEKKRGRPRKAKI